MVYGLLKKFFFRYLGKLVSAKKVFDIILVHVYQFLFAQIWKNRQIINSDLKIIFKFKHFCFFSYSLVAKTLEKQKKSNTSSSAKPNLLVNDGNFLERFKQMQQGATGKATSSGNDVFDSRIVWGLS